MEGKRENERTKARRDLNYESGGGDEGGTKRSQQKHETMRKREYENGQ